MTDEHDKARVAIGQIADAIMQQIHKALSLPNELEIVGYDRVADMLVHALLERGLIDVVDKAMAGSDVPWLKLAEAVWDYRDGVGRQPPPTLTSETDDD